MSMIGLILILMSFVLSVVITYDDDNLGNEIISLYYFFSSIAGGSLGFYGSTTLIILFNKFNGIFEILGWVCLIEYVTI